MFWKWTKMQIEQWQPSVDGVMAYLKVAYKATATFLALK